MESEFGCQEVAHALARHKIPATEITATAKLAELERFAAFINKANRQIQTVDITNDIAMF